MSISVLLLAWINARPFASLIGVGQIAAVGSGPVPLLYSKGDCKAGWIGAPEDVKVGSGSSLKLNGVSAGMTFDGEAYCEDVVDGGITTLFQLVRPSPPVD
jgi:hypothetical protein